MASLTLPEAGILLESPQMDASKLRAAPRAIGLTLTDEMIEDMIRCVQNNKPIQLCLGEAPKMNYGSNTQHLSKSQEPFHHDLFRTKFDEPISPTVTSHSAAEMSRPALKNKSNLPKSSNLLLANLGLAQYVPKPAASPPVKKTSATAGVDAALAALQSSLASEAARKQQNSTEFLKDALEPNQRKGGVAKNKSKLFSQNLHSTPSSPAISGYSSPMPASQKEAEEAKIARKPVVHQLAREPMTEIALRDAVDLSREELKLALSKVADRNESTSKWELKRNYWKELDVWTFDFAKPEHRQIVIDNAVRQYDKLRLARSDPEWERLLPKEERGTGKCLSKLQASIALGTIRTPKINVQKPEGDSTPVRDNNNNNNNNNDSKQSKTNGDMAKSTAPKTKAISKPLPKATTKSTAKDSATSKSKKILSSEYAHSDDEDDLPPSVHLKPKPKDVAKVNGTKRPRVDDTPSDATPPKKAKKVTSSKTNEVPQPVKPTKPAKSLVRKDEKASSQERNPIKKPNRTSTPAATTAPKTTAKRPRDEESTDSSDTPLSKKVKKNVMPAHRTSDLSQNTSSSSFKSKTATSSPHKSSPLASSPPTNASEIDRPGDRTSSSDSEQHTLKRHHKSSSIASSATSSNDGRRLTNGALIEAKRFKLYYERYEKLYRELEGMSEKDKGKLEMLLAMHERLTELKQKIYAGVLES